MPLTSIRICLAVQLCHRPTYGVHRTHCGSNHSSKFKRCPPPLRCTAVKPVTAKPSPCPGSQPDEATAQPQPPHRFPRERAALFTRFRHVRPTAGFDAHPRKVCGGFQRLRDGGGASKGLAMHSPSLLFQKKQRIMQICHFGGASAGGPSNACPPRASWWASLWLTSPTFRHQEYKTRQAGGKKLSQ